MQDSAEHGLEQERKKRGHEEQQSFTAKQRKEQRTNGHHPPLEKRYRCEKTSNIWGLRYVILYGWVFFRARRCLSRRFVGFICVFLRVFGETSTQSCQLPAQVTEEGEGVLRYHGNGQPQGTPQRLS